jgi:F-type H+-transporting ATPase subunit delta
LERKRVAEEAHFSGVAGRYALAVFELAQEQNSVDQVSRDFANLKEIVAASADLARLVRAPVFGREDQKKGMAAVLSRIMACRLTVQFVLLLAAKRRLFLLTDAIKAFDGLVSRQHGEIDAEVVAARPLAEGEVAALKQAIKSRLGREPRLTASVDPALIGGLVVKVGSRQIDSSLRTKLNALRTAMKS